MLVVIVRVGTGLVGCSRFTSNDGVGSIAKAAVTFDGTTYAKNAGICVIPTGKTANSNMAANPTDYNGQGVFISGRNVTLSPFAMGVYEITQELYNAVLTADTGSSASPDLFSESPAEGEVQGNRPVEYVTWRDAVYFCNALTKNAMTEVECVYSISDIGKMLRVGTYCI